MLEVENWKAQCEGVSGCNGLNVCSPLNSDAEILISKVMGSGGGAFGRELGYEGGAPRSGISALIKGGSGELPRPFHQVRTQWRGGSLSPGRAYSPAPDHAGTLPSDFQPPEP